MREGAPRSCLCASPTPVLIGESHVCATCGGEVECYGCAVCDAPEPDELYIEGAGDA